MEHRYVDIAGLAHQVDAPPVGAVPFLVKVLVEVGSGFLEAVNPVAQGQVAIPTVGKRLPEVARLNHILIHFRQQRIVAAPGQGVAAFQDGVRHRPAPFQRAAGVIHPGLVKV